MDSDNLVKTLYWDSVRSKLKGNNKLVNIIDKINPGKSLNFISIRYPFGVKIVNNGIICVPNLNGDFLPITAGQASNQYLQESIGYNLVPLGVITNNKVELFREMENRVFSIAVYGGELDFGIWEYFGWTTPYSMTAGARSLYMLPKISSARPHNKLTQAFNIASQPPKRVFDHWQVFKEIANSPHFTEPWYCEVIFFPKTWIKKLKSETRKSKSWSDLHCHLTEKMNQHSAYGRQREIFDIIWHLFAENLSKRNLRITPYIIETLIHLILVATGCLPASAPFRGDNSLGPLTTMQQIYTEIYQIDYVPTIMEPNYFNVNNSFPVYYSLQTPTLLESIPRNREVKSILAIARELHKLITLFLNEGIDAQLKIKDTAINAILENINFDFFHTGSPIAEHNIRSTATIPQEDPSFLYTQSASKSQNSFAENSTFLRGAARISSSSL